MTMLFCFFDSLYMQRCALLCNLGSKHHFNSIFDVVVSTASSTSCRSLLLCHHVLCNLKHCTFLVAVLTVHICRHNTKPFMIAFFT